MGGAGSAIDWAHLTIDGLSDEGGCVWNPVLPEESIVVQQLIQLFRRRWVGLLDNLGSPFEDVCLVFFGPLSGFETSDVHSVFIGGNQDGGAFPVGILVKVCFREVLVNCKVLHGELLSSGAFVQIVGVFGVSGPFLLCQVKASEL